MEQIQLVRVPPLQIHRVRCADAVAFALTQDSLCLVFTPNAVMLDAARRDTALAELLLCADLSLADGVGILLAARRAGADIPCRVAGVEFGEALLARCAAEELRVFLLGGREGVADRAAENLCARYNGLYICGTHSGYFDEDDREGKRVLETIVHARPDVLLVCMGFPRQETWLVRHREALSGVRVAAALGGSIDVWAGNCRRAPSAISHIGMEWAWRMLCEPHRMMHLPALVRCAFYHPKKSKRIKKG